MSEIYKEIGKIWSRLFDHKAFLNGEIQFMLNELERKRGDREVETLFLTLENVTDIKDTQIRRCKQSVDITLQHINVDLSHALSLCNRIYDLELKFNEDTTLELQKENRKSEWEKFIGDITDNCEKIDKVFDVKKLELQEFYSDLEKKLII